MQSLLRAGNVWRTSIWRQQVDLAANNEFPIPCGITKSRPLLTVHVSLQELRLFISYHSGRNLSYSVISGMGAQLASRGCQRAATLSGAESSDMMQSAIEDGEEDAMGTTSQQTSAGIPTKRLIGALQSHLSHTCGRRYV